MATIRPLPARNERSAPEWDSKYEAQLPMFFEEFESVAQAAGIDTNDAEMKKGVLRYADYESLQFWRTLPTFKDATKTWGDFKAEVLSEYPGAKKVAAVTTEDLNKVVSEFAQSRISNSQELGTYHRKFSIIAHSLQKHGILSLIQISSWYAQAFSESFRMRLEVQLCIENPTKTRGEAYSLIEIHKAVEFLLSDTTLPMKESLAYLMTAVKQGVYDDEPEGEEIRQLLYKLETRRAGRERAKQDVPEPPAFPKASPPAPLPLAPAPSPPNLGPAHVTKPVIGELPPIYIPSQMKDDPRIFTANDKTRRMLGVAKDVPFHFDEVTTILQVLDSPAYDIPLGRSFEVLNQARTQSFLSGDQHITLTDSNFERVITIPTIPREPPQFWKKDGREWRVIERDRELEYTVTEIPLAAMMEFHYEKDRDRALLVVEVPVKKLIPKWECLPANHSIPLRSTIVGPEPSIDQFFSPTSSGRLIHGQRLSQLGLYLKVTTFAFSLSLHIVLSRSSLACF